MDDAELLSKVSGGGRQEDELLSALLIQCKLLGISVTAEQLVAGLPLADNRLTPGLIERALSRVGLSSKLAERPLTQLSSLLLPCVLLLQGGGACILLTLEGDQAEVILPELGDAKTRLPLAELSQRHSGFVVLVKPEYKPDPTNKDIHHAKNEHWFWGTLTKFLPIFRDVLIASFFINLLALLSPLFTMNVYDRVVPNQAFETLWVLAIGIGVAYVLDFILKSLRAYYLEVTGKKIDIILSSRLFEQTLNLRMEVKPTSIGSYASNLKEFDSVRNFFTSATMVTLIDFPFAILALITIAWIGLPMMWVPIIAMPLLFIYSYIATLPIMKSVEHVYGASAQKNAVLIESLAGMETLRVLGAEYWAQRKWENAVAYAGKWGIKLKNWTVSIAHVSAIIQQIASIATVVVGVYLIAEQELSMGGLIACVILTSRAIAPMAQAAGLLASYQQTALALKGLNDIMARPVERDAKRQYVQRQTFNGNIEFKEVTFKYPGQEMNALEKVSVKINAGEHVGIIGKIGSGKSTISKLVLGLYAPESGSIRLDDIDVKQLSLSDLRSHIGYVPQDVVLFSGSLKENLLLGAPLADDEAILQAADLSGVTDFANQHPRGFDMMIGERGEGLSGGQRQCIGIARALIHKPNVLLLDEPTNSMDFSTEERFKQRLQEWSQGKTLILVTHKASLLTLVNRLIVVHQGRIVADGPKEAVLEALKQGRLKVS